ncbi:hypothetical protein HETIRDRAFT_412751 [Heterobasidion irregulare TC 32-1]|uniref:Uncharacterized protein n=1 Tax=Heterobasidion irregulare (strain TC 32-1) TaxID=747525 RepID=W4JPN9_HETIT|nr:uncharacterized protein HETIRDRAFT_412751 [Heterobasidion irregulare TC 32-1]ETW74831.1 hypothetical protein HETIRDRAFT_412751 [Heterobasidion irregulare TC 32-1]
MDRTFIAIHRIACYAPIIDATNLGLAAPSRLPRITGQVHSPHFVSCSRDLLSFKSQLYLPPL